MSTNPLIETPGVSRLVGDFEIVRELGRGSMGVVYEALQHPLERRVALKTFTAAGRSPNALERFKREAGAAAKLSHPGIVPVWAVGEEGELHYYAMQLVEGKTLRELVHGTPLEPHRVAVIAKRIAEALDYAHSQGVIHRDLKPANIIVKEGDQPVITDFGLAKNLNLSALTQVGAVLGTPTHMSPEQARGDSDIDHRVDVYGLGACMYEMLAGRLPFHADNLGDLLRKVVEEVPEPPSSARSDIPPDLDAITMRCIAKKREDRFGSAGALARELERFLRGEKIETRGPVSFARMFRDAPLLVAAGPLTLGLIALLIYLIVHAGGVSREVAGLESAARAAEGRGDAAAGLAAAERLLEIDPDNKLGREMKEAMETLEKRQAAEARVARIHEEVKKQTERGTTAARRADRLSGVEAEKATIEALDALGAAIALDPQAEEAREARGAIWLRRARDAEARSDPVAAQAYMDLVRESNASGAFDAALTAQGTLSVRTLPDGARVSVERIVPVESLGETRREKVSDESAPPVGSAGSPLAAGSYVVTAEADGYAPALVPVLIERQGREELTIRLLKPSEVPRGFVYVPAGPFTAGGDPAAIRALPRKRVQLPGFFIAERETTVAEFAEFLSSLPMEEALRMAPRGGARQRHAALFWPENGHWKYPALWPADRPVCGVSFDAAVRYALWRGTRDGAGAVRLPTELEWEKACRGADGRSFPWGEADAAGRAVMGGESGSIQPRPVGTSERDVSIFGVRDMMGNVAEWTSGQFAPSLPFRIVRGGAFAAYAEPARAASRYPTDPEDPPEYVGIRLARDLPE